MRGDVGDIDSGKLVAHRLDGCPVARKANGFCCDSLDAIDMPGLEAAVPCMIDVP